MSTYIKLEDVQKILEKNLWLFEKEEWQNIVKSKINSLPSIDFEEMIKEKFEMCKEQASDSDRHFWWMIVCEQLLNKLTK